MKEHEKAKRWRESLGLTRAELGERLGYSAESLYWYERGETPQRTYKGKLKHDRRVDPWVWTRYKMACNGLDAEIYGRRKGFVFDWEAA